MPRKVWSLAEEVLEEVEVRELTRRTDLERTRRTKSPVGSQ